MVASLCVLGVLCGKVSMTDRSRLQIDLLAPSAAQVGQRVPITIRVGNQGREPLELHLLGREIAFDVVIRDGAGFVVWQRLQGAFTQGILQLKTLEPGGWLELHTVWTPAGAGTYTVEGIVPTDEPEPLRTPVVRVRVTPGG